MVKRIQDLERYDKKGWQWKIKRTEYRTDKNGEGLWTYSRGRGWKQQLGHMQFELPKDRKKAYNKLYYEFVSSVPEYWDDL